MISNEEIIEWAVKQHCWVSDAIKTFYEKGGFEENDIERFVEECISEQEGKGTRVDLTGLNLLQHGEQGCLAICAINNVEGVNALKTGQSLKFSPEGITVVYGDNGAGKSGYIRIIKQVSNARYKEDIKGNVYTKELCEKLDVPYKQIGALVVAFSEEEKKTLEELKQRGITNGVPDMEIWDKEKLLKEEPNLSDKAVAALSSPNVGIVSPWELALALAETAVLNGVEVKLNTEVSGIEKENDTYKIETNNGVIEAKYICNAAGVFADKVNEMCNEKTFEITPNKGEYYLMDKSQGNLVNHVIFQCPNEKGKGVLVAPTVHGNLIVGPDSQPSAANDVSTTKQGLDFVRNTALKSVPGINFRESIRNFAGVRARTADHDFHIYEDKNNKGFINIAGMQSPGLSSACAIAPDILKMLENSGLTLEAKEDIVDERHIDRFKHLSHEDREKLVEKNPAFGKIICRCETITEGEIINAVHRPIPATSIDAVKRRCNAGMGRCQGGFCGPRVQEIIARELNKPLADIPQDRLETNIITGETKDGGAK